jgi:hypothetical protein
MLANLALSALAVTLAAAAPSPAEPPLTPEPNETPAAALQPAPVCADTLRRIASGLGGELQDMRLTRSPTWGLIWRGRLKVSDIQGARESAVVCASRPGSSLVVDAARRVAADR